MMKELLDEVVGRQVFTFLQEDVIGCNGFHQEEYFVRRFHWLMATFITMMPLKVHISSVCVCVCVCACVHACVCVLRIIVLQLNFINTAILGTKFHGLNTEVALLVRSLSMS